jgi:hypothetical protein
VSPRREVPLDAREILAALARHDVDYLLIGGMAVQVHGHPRTTQDADVLPAPDERNLRRLAAALADLGARPAGAGAAPEGWDLEQELLTAAVVSLDTDAGGVDVHREPPGAAGFADLAGRALTVEVLGIEVAVVGLDDLIAMKRASGRPLDRGDVIALTEPLEP